MNEVETRAEYIDPALKAELKRSLVPQAFSGQLYSAPRPPTTSWLINDVTSRPGDSFVHISPDELWALTFAEANAWRDRFAAVPFEDKGGSHPARFYQDIAVERVREAIAAEQQRILLTLVAIRTEFSDRQQAFLDFVLAHYVREGVQELDQEKLAPLLKLRYHDSISDAIAALGDAKLIGRIFAGFQKYLYQPQAAA